MNVLEELIYPAVDEAADGIDGADKLVKAAETPLYGTTSPLDSLGLVSFLLIVEEQIEDTLDQTVAIVDERAVSRANSPFRTLGSLAEYVGELIDAK
jgi:D-alanine--poly(phosphoribitol) ligase subunit 2